MRNKDIEKINEHIESKLAKNFDSMGDKIVVKLDQFRQGIVCVDTRISNMFSCLESLVDKLKENNTLMELLTDKYTGERYELVYIKPYRGTPLLFKDGKQVDINECQSVYINSDAGERSTVEINK